jgi:hypothetical protein
MLPFGTIAIRDRFDDFGGVGNMHEWHTTGTDLQAICKTLYDR